LGLFVLFALIPLILYKTKNVHELDRSSKNVSPLEFIYFFKQRGMGGHVLLLFLFYSGLIGILTMIKPYFVDLGYDIKEIGVISGIFGTACGVAMTIPTGLYIRKKGIIKSIWLFPIINLTVASYFFWLTFTNHAIYLVYIGVALLWGAYAMSSVFIYTLGMHVIRKGREGTDFTIQIVITHLSSLIIAISSGKIADVLGYRGLFAIEVGIGVLILFLLPFIFKKKFYEKDDSTLPAY
jgi:predicted MFS family arabinose efflux permease